VGGAIGMDREAAIFWRKHSNGMDILSISYGNACLYSIETYFISKGQSSILMEYIIISG
jgi:hypothetical protein